VSDNGGKSFDRQVARVTDANASSPFALVDASTVVCSSDGQLERTTDGGKQWTPVAIDKTVVTDAPVSGFLGFESSTTGRWVSGNGSTIYTTTDSGQKWTPYTFK
jgi:hypothetical protein